MRIQSSTYIHPDLLFNILNLLPVKTLLRLKCLSKEWCEVISSRSFIKAHMEKTELVRSVFFILTSSSSAILYPTIFSFLPEQVVVLASCNGLICCRSCFPQNSNNSETTLYVCNPTNNEYIRLSSGDYRSCESIALAFDPCEDLKDESTNFRLVRVKSIPVGQGHLHLQFWIYSSETRLWVRSQVLRMCKKYWIKKEGIYIQGVIYWLTNSDGILTFNVRSERSWLISAPRQSSQFRTKTVACIGESKGILHYIMVSEQGLHVWCLDGVKWEVKFRKSLEEIKGKYPQFFFNLAEDKVSPWMDPLALKNGILVIKVCGNFYFYDIWKDMMAQPYNLPDIDARNLPDPIVIPYRMSLVPLN